MNLIFNTKQDFSNYLSMYPEEVKAELQKLLDTRFVWETTAILADSDTCKITYVYKNYDPKTYSPLFRELLTVWLAYKLAPYIKDSRAFTTELYQEEIDKINNSANRESMQGDDEFLPEDNWIKVRRV